MNDYLQQCITGANLPATVLLGLVIAYWLLVMLGSLDLDFLDFDIDLDGQPDSPLSVGFLGMRLLNLGRVPVMVWMSVFAVTLWVLSMLCWFVFDREGYEASLWLDAQYLLRNVTLSVVLTKLITQPMIFLFDSPEEYGPDQLIGRECEVSTVEANMDFGQARFSTDGAPLLLNVRTTAGTLAKGDRAEIVDYDPDSGIYLISKAD